MRLHRSVVALLTVFFALQVGCASTTLVVPPLPERTAPLAEREVAFRALAPVRGTWSAEAPTPVVRINGAVVSDPRVYGAIVANDAELDAAIDELEALRGWAIGLGVTSIAAGVAGAALQGVGFSTMFAGGFNPSADTQPANDEISRGYRIALGGGALSVGALASVMLAGSLLGPHVVAANDLVVDRYDAALRARLELSAPDGDGR